MPECLCDINFLLSIVTDRHKGFSVSTSWLDQQGNSSLGLCRLTQLGLLRLLSTKAVMGEDVCSQEQAWHVWEQLQSDQRFSFWNEPSISALGELSLKILKVLTVVQHRSAGPGRTVR